MIANRLTTDLVSHGVPRRQASTIATRATQSQFGSAPHGGTAARVVHDSIAYGMRAVLFSMAGVMVCAFLAALIGLRRGIHHASDVGESAGQVDRQPEAEGAH
jgi:hypothetical protein